MTLLAEQLFLLSIDPKTKRPYGRASATLPYSLSGALLAELVLEGQIEMQRSKLGVIDSEVADPLLQESLTVMQHKKKKTPKYWVSALKRTHKNLPREMAIKLDHAGVGSMEEKRVLGVFSSYTYTFDRANFIQTTKKSFQVVLEKINKHEALAKEEERIVVLMSFVHVSNLIRIVFSDRKEAKQAEKQIKKRSKNLPVPQAVKATIDSIHASIFAAAGSASRS
ncbi:GOLPH3/VPS74 family protein [Gracilibacillus phocaeensis]|uniref:GOLPH3/VPS74 family protein n=1 Tax=Gracilibacillus phocaeensis TaxID=2042304 RepID=UPI0010318918|nr:GPP34 family phosphoprotein [Gracilibacillus phocaeensis]